MQQMMYVDQQRPVKDELILTAGRAAIILGSIFVLDKMFDINRRLPI